MALRIGGRGCTRPVCGGHLAAFDGYGGGRGDVVFPYRVVARGELRTAVAELEKLTIRAPIASTVLQVNAKVGELASPSAPQVLALLGDLTGLRVRAEVDERDVGKIKLGGRAVVRADAFRGREFSGKVVSIAPLVQPARINSPGSRNLSDFSVTDVLIELSDPGPLLVGMKVDVYFQNEVAAQ